MKKVEASQVRSVIAETMLADVVPIVYDIEKSHGNRLVCEKTGDEYLDGASFFASNPVGYNHPKLNDANFQEKLLRVARTKPSNSDFFSCEMAEFVSTFARIAKPAEFKYLFFIEGGALAVENALKTAFDWKVRKNLAKGLGEKGSQIIHFKQAFHGRTGYTLSLTNTADPRKYQYFPLFKWPRVTNPKLKFPVTEEVLTQVREQEKIAILEIESAFKNNPDDIAAIIIETVQGEGGDNHFRKEFLEELRRLANENEALLIFDEVQAGLGISGKMWAYQNYGVVPDIVCFGKKTQVCGIMVSPRVDEVEGHVFKESSRINSTWGGNLTDMVRSQRYLEIIEEDGLVENAARVGEYLKSKLEELQSEFPELLSNARGLGLFAAIDVSTTDKRDELRNEILKRKVLLLRCGTHSIRFRPSLTFSEAEVDEMCGVFREAVRGL